MLFAGQHWASYLIEELPQLDKEHVQKLTVNTPLNGERLNTAPLHPHLGQEKGKDVRAHTTYPT